MTVTIEEAKTRLHELIAQLPANDELVIVDDGQPVAKLFRIEKKTWPCQPGSAKHIPHWMAPDFNAPLEDFREYME
jgi:antitoxin (DNA-binding transcriptional repressor) of toxin-antitoxin stability system